MAIVSDTNILSSFAAADALHLLPKLFQGDTIYIPPAVEQELHKGLDYGQKHIELIFLQVGDIQVLHLTDAERSLIASLPAKLHAGEREGIVLCQKRAHLFLSNDRRAIRYCQAYDIDALSLEILLRFLWTREIVSLSEVRTLIETMAAVENLTLSQRQRAIIFAPHSNY
ncbi:MAG: hypothetical protein ABFS56_30870 [Pseudomonadota bacterium]